MSGSENISTEAAAVVATANAVAAAAEAFDLFDVDGNGFIQRGDLESVSHNFNTNGVCIFTE